MRQVLVATHNAGKLAEFRRILVGIEVLGAADFALAEPQETETSFAGNARLKAVAAARVAGVAAIADDSGLCVAAMGGGPGVFSARFAGGDYPGALARVIAACAAAREWRARFVCALCIADAAGGTRTFIGQADGRIAKVPAGTGGFGYDPIFVPDGYSQTYAVLGSVKDGVSHRARAVAQLVRALGVN